MDKRYSMPVPLLGLLVKIKVFGVLPAHWALVLDAVTVLVFVLLMICAGFVWVGGEKYTRFKIAVHCAGGCCTATTMALTYAYLNSSMILGADHWCHMSFGRWKLTIRVHRYLGQGVSRHTTRQLANQEPYYALSDHMTNSKVWPIDFHFNKQL